MRGWRVALLWIYHVHGRSGGRRSGREGGEGGEGDEDREERMVNMEVSMQTRKTTKQLLTVVRVLSFSSLEPFCMKRGRIVTQPGACILCSIIFVLLHDSLMLYGLAL